MDEGGLPCNFALLGAGTFSKQAYVGIIKDLGGYISLRYVWSRSQESAEKLVSVIRVWSPSAVAIWGEEGLDKFFNHSPDVEACAIVLPIQTQPEITKRALMAGKHVLQEKPIAASVSEALLLVKFAAEMKPPRLFSIAENFRFEPALESAAKHVNSLGRMTVFHVGIETAMNPRNRYFNSQWRRDPDFFGAFVLDCGVHYVAALRLLTGQEVTSVVAVASHRDPAVPPPDNLTAVMVLSNGCTGTFSVSFSSCSNRMSWRVVCEEGSVDVKRGAVEGKFGFTVDVVPREGEIKAEFYPFSGVENELKAFARDVAGYPHKNPDWRSSPAEALKDLEVIERALKSGMDKANVS